MAEAKGRDPMVLFDVTIVDKFGVKRIYEPQSDMTGQEAALCAHGTLTATMASMQGFGVPLWDYITNHNLERHFPPKVEIALP